MVLIAGVLRLVGWAVGGNGLYFVLTLKNEKKENPAGLGILGSL
jgi:hypothetical protein